MQEKDVLNYFDSLNKNQKFNWICSFMTLAMKKESDERNTVNWYRNSDSDHWLFNYTRSTFRKKIINSYKKPTQTKLHSIVAEVNKFSSSRGMYDTPNMGQINYIFSYIYSYIGQELIEDNKFSRKKTTYLTKKRDCISCAVSTWLTIHRDDDESERLSELKNLSTEFDKDFWSTKDQKYTPKKYVKPIVKREVIDLPRLSTISGAGQTKLQIYDRFIAGVQAGELPSIDIAIREMETADDHIEESK